MSWSKLVLFSVAWILAAVSIAVVAAIVFTELLDVIGIVESGQQSYTRVINTIALVVFIALLAVPVVLRSRFSDA